LGHIWQGLKAIRAESQCGRQNFYSSSLTCNRRRWTVTPMIVMLMA
jgi:hypothetical protein